MNKLKNFFLPIIISIFFFLPSCRQKDERVIRRNVSSVEAISDLEALDKALSIMKSLDCDNPTSWYYQSAIHWVPDSIRSNKLCPSYQTFLEKKEGWDNCTHTHTPSDEINFLVWHRLYIWHFEKIVRKLSGKKDFALPYWAYTNDNELDRKLPEIFRNPLSPLYQNCRFDSLNQGFPIQGEATRGLDITKLMTYNNYEMFAKNIDVSPHGAIHDYVGHGNDYNDGKLWFENPITQTKTHDGLMGWVPTAAFDPVFWIHHSNIDRIWQIWTNSDFGQMVTLEQLESNPFNYVFFDENGKKIVYTPKQILSILYTMDYDFDDVKLKAKPKEERPVRTQNTVIVKSIDTPVNSQITDAVTITKPKTSNVFVTVEIEVSYTDLPRGVYEIYVNANGVYSPKADNFVGFMNFFGNDHKMSGKPCFKGCCTPLINGRPGDKFTYQIPNGEKFNFTVYKHNGFHSGDLRLEKITIRE